MLFDNLTTMDSAILLSLVNMKLRNEFNGNLTEFTTSYAIDKAALENKLAGAGFLFNEVSGAFLST